MSSQKAAHKTTGEQWTEWAAAAQDGDKTSYNRLLKEIAPFIRNYIVGSLANPDWADDITQEVLISVHKSLKTFSPDRPFRPWLMSIVSFRRTDFLRKHYSRKGDKKISLDDVVFTKEQSISPEHAGEFKDVENALNVLPDKQRKIFQMLKIQGYSAKEVAQEMDMSESAVKVSAHRAMNKLKGELQ